MPKATALGYGQDVPYSVDWRAQGAVTEIKDQRSCGSTYRNQGPTLLWQELLGVRGGGGNGGARQNRDGQPDLYVGAAGAGLHGRQEQLRQRLHQRRSPLRGHQRRAAAGGGLRVHRAEGRVPQQTLRQAQLGRLRGRGPDGEPVRRRGALQGLAARQPVAVMVDASEPDFRHYSSGVYAGSASCGGELNQAMTVVGYGTENGAGEYWLVKNQWGTWWGENGYMRVARRNGAGANCGIASFALYPTMYYS